MCGSPATGGGGWPLNCDAVTASPLHRLPCRRCCGAVGGRCRFGGGSVPGGLADQGLSAAFDLAAAVCISCVGALSALTLALRLTKHAIPPPPPVPPQDPKHTIELVGPTDLERLRIWHGQSVSLGVEVDGQQQLKWVVNNDPDWRSLAEVLPATEVRCGAMLEGRIDGGALLHPPSCGKGLVW